MVFSHMCVQKVTYFLCSFHWFDIVTVRYFRLVCGYCPVSNAISQSFALLVIDASRWFCAASCRKFSKTKEKSFFSLILS